MRTTTRLWSAAVAAVVLAGTYMTAGAVMTRPEVTPVRSERSTTAAALAMQNLEASLDGLDQRLRAGSAPPSRRAELAELLMMRARFLGRVSDSARALDLAESLLQESPRDGTLILLRGRTRAALHLFPEALKDFDDAARAGADVHAVAGARASVLQAIGRLDEAIVLRAALAEAKPDIRSLGSLAVAQGEGGDLAASSATFRRARSAYRDVSPFPLAWTYFQEGKLYFAAGKLDRAQALFMAAVDQLPNYAAALGHLGEVHAALGRRAEAAERLRSAAVSAEDPDSEGQLCRVLKDLGQFPAAESCRIRVSARYESLLDRHPEAFWDHAAEFFLAMDEPQKALGFARRNVALRPTRAAFDLALRAATAAGALSEAASIEERRARLTGRHSPGIGANDGVTEVQAPAGC